MINIYKSGTNHPILKRSIIRSLSHREEQEGRVKLSDFLNHMTYKHHLIFFLRKTQMYQMRVLIRARTQKVTVQNHIYTNSVNFFNSRWNRRKILNSTMQVKKRN